MFEPQDTIIWMRYILSRWKHSFNGKANISFLCLSVFIFHLYFIFHMKCLINRPLKISSFFFFFAQFLKVTFHFVTTKCCLYSPCYIITSASLPYMETIVVPPHWVHTHTQWLVSSLFLLVTLFWTSLSGSKTIHDTQYIHFTNSKIRKAT